MAAHIPDNGNCFIVHGPHVGITQAGVVGKVERAGIKLVDTCCGSAIAANNYLKGITDGGAKITTQVENWSDFQQGAVQQLILPHAQRLKAAGSKDEKHRMIELPYALYTSQDLLLQDIIEIGKASLKKGTAVLGGIQINTSPDTLDYFHPLRFDYMDDRGNKMDLLPLLTSQTV
jgi:Limiting CO2-inducible proteins B/C beta carbonyic anhydrases